MTLVVKAHLEPFFGATRAAALHSANLDAYKRHVDGASGTRP